MGNSNTINNNPKQQKSGTTIQQVTVKIQVMKRIMLELNLCIDELQNMPYVKEVNNIDESVVCELYQHFFEFTQDIRNLKLFLYPQLSDTSVNCKKDKNENMSSNYDPFSTVQKVSDNKLCQQINRQAKKIEDFSQQLDFLNTVQKMKNNSRQSSCMNEQFFSMIYQNDEPNQQLIHSAHHTQLNSHKKSDSQLAPIKQQINQENDQQHNHSSTNAESQSKHLHEQNLQLKHQLTQLQETNTHLNTLMIQLQERIKKLEEEKDDIQKQAHQLNEISFIRTESEKNFSNMIDHF